MAEIGRWNGFKFLITPSIIRGFTGLTVKGSCATKEKTKSKQAYLKRQNGKPAEVSLTVVMSAGLGCDVRKEALSLVSCATAGKKAYFYVGQKKLLACKLMLVEASIREVDVGEGNKWVHAEVQLSMKQSNKGSASSGGKRKKKSVKKSSSRKRASGSRGGSASGVGGTAGKNPSDSAKDLAVRQTTKKVVSGATATIKKICTAAKKLTASRKTVSSGGGKYLAQTR